MIKSFSVNETKLDRSKGEEWQKKAAFVNHLMAAGRRTRLDPQEKYGSPKTSTFEYQSYEAGALAQFIIARDLGLTVPQLTEEIEQIVVVESKPFEPQE